MQWFERASLGFNALNSKDLKGIYFIILYPTGWWDKSCIPELSIWLCSIFSVVPYSKDLQFCLSVLPFSNCFQGPKNPKTQRLVTQRSSLMQQDDGSFFSVRVSPLRWHRCSVKAPDRTSHFYELIVPQIWWELTSRINNKNQINDSNQQQSTTSLISDKQSIKQHCLMGHDRSMFQDFKSTFGFAVMFPCGS